MSQLPDDLQNNIVVRDPDPDGFPVLLDRFGHLVAGRKDKGIWTGKIGFHHFKCVVVHMPGIIGEMAQIGTYEREPGFLGFDALDACNPFHGPGFGYITTHAVNCIGGIYNDPTVIEQLNDLADLPGIRIPFIQFYQHLLEINRVKVV